MNAFPINVYLTKRLIVRVPFQMASFSLDETPCITRFLSWNRTAILFHDMVDIKYGFVGQSCANVLLSSCDRDEVGWTALLRAWIHHDLNVRSSRRAVLENRLFPRKITAVSFSAGKLFSQSRRREAALARYSTGSCCIIVNEVLYDLNEQCCR